MGHYKKIALITFISLFLSTGTVGAAEISFGPEESDIKTAIRYTVIGKYRAEFEEYSGAIGIDSSSRAIRSVSLTINPASIRSNCEWCDKIVKSKQLLWVEKFPDIIFKSEEIAREADHFLVKGALDLHGVVKPIAFPFYVQGWEDYIAGASPLNVRGQWLIHRKDYGITWNKLLDKGGVFVGEYITVDWEISVPFFNKGVAE
ncbi:MAG TPA: YceI family protein [Candidatus Omnitrophota bacterium]|nr:YceI family protein [Candidatus Omnitrophota bacterium]